MDYVIGGCVTSRVVFCILYFVFWYFLIFLFSYFVILPGHCVISHLIGFQVHLGTVDQMWSSNSPHFEPMADGRLAISFVVTEI